MNTAMDLTTGRNAHQAIDKLLEYLNNDGYTYIVDIDLEKFFAYVFLMINDITLKKNNT